MSIMTITGVWTQTMFLRRSGMPDDVRHSWEAAKNIE